MATVATNKLWAYIESLSLSRRDRNWLAGKLLEPTHDADPLAIPLSMQTFPQMARQRSGNSMM